LVRFFYAFIETDGYFYFTLWFTLQYKVKRMEHQKHLENLSELKSILSKNTRFLSFSGLSGVIAGITALAGEYLFYNLYLATFSSSSNYADVRNLADMKLFYSALLIALSIIGISVIVGVILARKKIRMQGSTVNRDLLKNTLIHILVPILVGGAICFVASFTDHFIYIPAFLLIFYGLGLFNGSRFSFDDLKIVGLVFMGLGLITYAYPNLSMWTWGLGFGVGHILYGLRVYFVHDRKSE